MVASVHERIIDNDMIDSGTRSPICKNCVRAWHAFSTSLIPIECKRSLCASLKSDLRPCT